MRHAFLAFALLACFAGGPARADDDADWEACKGDDPVAALPACTRIIEKADTDQDDRAIAHYNRGNAHAGTKDYEKAIADYDKAIELDPTDAEFHNNRGDTYRLWGKLDLALADLDRALEIDDKLRTAYTARGFTHTARGDHLAATRDFTRAIEIDPDVAGHWLDRARAHIARRLFALAEFDATKAIELEPDLAEAWALRGQALWQRHENARALADYDKALELDPDVENGAADRAGVLIDLAEYDRAVVELDKLVAKDEADTGSRINRGLAHHRAGRPDQAKADAEESLRREPKRPDAFELLAAILEKRGDLAGALAAMKTSRELEAGEAKRLFVESLEAEIAGDRVAALATIREARQIAPRDLEIKDRMERLVAGAR